MPISTHAVPVWDELGKIGRDAHFMMSRIHRYFSRSSHVFPGFDSPYPLQCGSRPSGSAFAFVEPVPGLSGPLKVLSFETVRVGLSASRAQPCPPRYARRRDMLFERVDSVTESGRCEMSIAHGCCHGGVTQELLHGDDWYPCKGELRGERVSRVPSDRAQCCAAAHPFDCLVGG